MVIVGRIALPLGRGRNAGDGQFLWPRRAPIIGHYRTLHTMVIFGRIALPFWALCNAGRKELRDAKYVAERDGLVTATAEGLKAAGEVPPAPSTPAERLA